MTAGSDRIALLGFILCSKRGAVGYTSPGFRDGFELPPGTSQLPPSGPLGSALGREFLGPGTVTLSGSCWESSFAEEHLSSL